MTETKKIKKIHVTNGIYWIEIPEADIYVQCGCPADSVKHLMKKGLIAPIEKNGVTFEAGPNAILLSDVMLQGGDFSNLAEFPVLQMLYRQGMLLPGHPNNTGAKPLIMGLAGQVKAHLEYIYRGNYGLVTEEEIAKTGFDVISPSDLMRLKLKFAFGKILDPKELLDTLHISSTSVEIKNNVFIKRMNLNIYEFEYQGEKMIVDLNLPPTQNYVTPYQLGAHQVKKHYFSVVHSGDGDGWDINRPSMASVLVFQGKIFLVDAGPNILSNLMALGIGINEVEGIFITHSHDDHFSGMASLLRSDRRIKHYATPLVRASIGKKLSALLSISEDCLGNYFDSRDIHFNMWNDVGGLDVMPVFSPHPVETSCLYFRARGDEGDKTYAHMADIASLDALEGMVVESDQEHGISRDLFDKVKMDYLMAADLKKIDIGGGMIHGNAEDFREDRSHKIILSHTANELTPQQQEIGSGAKFGDVDVLIKGRHDYAIREALIFLKSYFLSVSEKQFEPLLNNPVMTYSPDTLLAEKGKQSPYVYLILTGNVERIGGEMGVSCILTAGALIGEIPGLLGQSMYETFRAASFVQALRINCEDYLEFAQRNTLFDEIALLHKNRAFLQSTSLFGESISYPIQNLIAKTMTIENHDAMVELKENGKSLFMVKSGAVERFDDQGVLGKSGKGEFFGEELSIFSATSAYRMRTTKPSKIFSIPSVIVDDIPAVRWRLFEAFERRKCTIN